LHHRSRTLYAIFAILAVIWLLVLLGTVLIFHYIVPFVYFHSFLDSILKGVFTAILVGIWLAVFIGLTNAFVRRFILQKPQSAMR
jgi:hypothetical protein